MNENEKQKQKLHKFTLYDVKRNGIEENTNERKIAKQIP